MFVSVSRLCVGTMEMEVGRRLKTSWGGRVPGSRMRGLVVFLSQGVTEGLRWAVLDAMALCISFAELCILWMESTYSQGLREEALVAWLDKQRMGVSLRRFGGTQAELQYLREHVQGVS